MKNIDWDKCKSYGTTGSYGENTKMEYIDNVNIVPDMKVDARYKDFIIFLKILKETSPNTFKALVTNIRGPKKERPQDLNINDEVSINREFICHISFPNH